MKILLTFHKFEDTINNYSKQIEDNLKSQDNFLKCNNLENYYWSDKNNKSVLKDYYPFTNESMINKIYLSKIYPNITIPNAISSNKDTIFFLKYYTNSKKKSNNIKISNEYNKLINYAKKNKEKFIIQKEIKPNLLDGYKYTIRVYTLIVFNSNFVYIYIYPGLLYLCKEKYIEGSINIDRQIPSYEKFIEMNHINSSIKEILYYTSLDFKPQTKIVGYQYLGYDLIQDDFGVYYLIKINNQPCLKDINYKIINDFSKLVANAIPIDKGYEPFISTDGIILLSELNMTHLNDLYDITKDIDTMKYIGNKKPWTLEKTKKFIESKNDKEYFYNGIILNKKIIGIIGRHNEFLTIYINKHYIGKGYGKKALSLFINITDRSLIADVLKYNNNSRQLFKSFNFKELDNVYRYYVK
jgi:RimJ/RimL family protein N-acetyltransferase